MGDCEILASNIAGGGSWTLVGDVQRTLATYGSCAFGAETTNVITYVGNQDIIDLIHSSIDMFTWNGLVGSKGSMTCEGGAPTTWGLYHT